MLVLKVSLVSYGSYTATASGTAAAVPVARTQLSLTLAGVRWHYQYRDYVLLVLLPEYYTASGSLSKLAWPAAGYY